MKFNYYFTCFCLAITVVKFIILIIQISEIELKLARWDEEYFAIPEIPHNSACIINLLSVEFARICRDLSQFGEIMVITCAEEGIFNCSISFDVLIYFFDLQL